MTGIVLWLCFYIIIIIKLYKPVRFLYINSFIKRVFIVDTVYSLTTEEDIMTDLYKYGPVQAAFYVYTDFMYYKTGKF